MKYWFLILICYAAKCEDVGNKYFVVEMPGDNLQQQNLKVLKKPFQVYWNVPTMQCASKKIPFQNLYEKFGIIQNDNDRFIGNKIVIIYNEIDFPAIIRNKTSGKNILRNGGVPQAGNLEKHLIAFENELNKKIPDPYFDGIGVIDFESWRPVFLQNFGSLVPHRHHSLEIEKQLHNWWPKKWIEREASLRFESASRRFMQRTLSMAKEMRPNALWGYYGFPHCFNMRGRDMSEKCVKDIDKENDSIYWLWAESTALFPSLYSSVSLSSSQLSSLIKGRVKETSRVRGRDTPIFPYFWFRYRDAGFLTEKDLEVVLTTLYQSNVSGFIIWGSSKDVNTVEKCNKLYNYVENVLGPKIAKFTKQIKRSHSNHLDNSQIYSNEISRVYDDLNIDQKSSTESTSDINKYTNTEESSQTLNNDEISSTDSSITYNGYSTTDDSQESNKYNLLVSLPKTSTIYSENIDTSKNIQALNYMSSTETFIDNEHANPDSENLQENKVDVFPTLSETSTAFSIDDNSLSRISTIYISNIEEGLQKSNNDIPKEDTLIIYNQYLDIKENSKTVNNNYVLNSDNKKTVSNDEMFSIDTSTIYSEYINTRESKNILNNNKISLEGTTKNYNNFVYEDPSTENLNNVKYLKETPSSNELPITNKITNILINNNMITEKNNLESTDDLLNYNNSSEDLLDYLIIVDNSTERETLKYPKYIETTNVDDDYLIIVQNKQKLKENIEDINFKIDNNYNIINKSEHLNETLNDLDVLENENYQDLTSAEDESSYIKDIDTSEDRADYLIQLYNYTNTETYFKSEHANNTNSDNDYLIIVRDLINGSKKKVNIVDNKLEDLSTTQIQADFVTETKIEKFSKTIKEFDPIVAYITKRVENIELKDSISNEEESFDNNNLKADKDGSDYLNKVDNSRDKQTDKLYDHKENISDNDNILIVKYFNKQNVINNIEKKTEHPSTPIDDNVGTNEENYDFNEIPDLNKYNIYF